MIMRIIILRMVIFAVLIRISAFANDEITLWKEAEGLYPLNVGHQSEEQVFLTESLMPLRSFCGYGESSEHTHKVHEEFAKIKTHQNLETVSKFQSYVLLPGLFLAYWRQMGRFYQQEQKIAEYYEKTLQSKKHVKPASRAHIGLFGGFLALLGHSHYNLWVEYNTIETKHASERIMDLHVRWKEDQEKE